MANHMVGDLAGLTFPNKQKATPGTYSGHTGVGTTANFADITSMRAALQASNPSYYTNALLDRLTTNDMVFALRLANGGNTAAGSI